jgi:glycerol-3-phosphate dehydrogenase (NAD(P)+)
MKITILGGGSWGTALAVHLASKQHDIRVWEFFEEQAKEMQDERVCKLLPEVKLPSNIFITSDLKESLNDSELILVVVPSDKVEQTIEKAKEFISQQKIVICSKGFASNLRLLSDVVKEKVSGKVYCLYGPTHAEEVCRGMFSGIVLAGKDNSLKEVFESEDFIVDYTSDIIGLQVSAALKNILAVFIGVLDGAKLGDNAKAYVITRGLEEIKQVALAFGAKEETVYGLAGIGDIIVTSTSKHSRNRFVGQEVGKGRELKKVIDEMNMIAEGVTTVKEAIGLKEKFNLELPLITGLYEILFNGKDVKEILRTI